MTAVDGTTLPYKEYLDRYRTPEQKPVVWNWKALARSIAMLDHDERGTHVMLSIPEGDAACDIVPGISMAVQIVKAGGATKSHAHSWWHLYVVVDGRGAVEFGDPASVRQLEAGDVLMVPGWCPHRLIGEPGGNDLRLFRVQNLPQLSRLANVAIKESGQPLSAIHTQNRAQPDDVGATVKRVA
jgi:gentisate 1,2-dioxygenase